MSDVLIPVSVSRAQTQTVWGYIYTIEYVNTLRGVSLASGSTYSPRINLSIYPQFLNQADIFNLSPGMKSGIMSYSPNSTVAMVIVGRVGLADRQILVNMGNGQWWAR